MVDETRSRTLLLRLEMLSLILSIASAALVAFWIIWSFFDPPSRSAYWLTACGAVTALTGFSTHRTLRREANTSRAAEPPPTSSKDEDPRRTSAS